MTTNYLTIKNALVSVIAGQAQNRYRTIGHKTSRQQAAVFEGMYRSVQVTFEEADFDKSSSRKGGNLAHPLSFKIVFTVAMPSKMDISALDAPWVTINQRAAILEATQTASALAENSLDELYGIVAGVLMDLSNRFLLLDDERIVIDGWVGNFKKLNLQDRSRQGISELYGDLVVLMAEMEYSCKTFEDLTGVIPNSVQPKTFDIKTAVTKDTNGALIDDAGVKVVTQ